MRTIEIDEQDAEFIAFCLNRVREDTYERINLLEQEARKNYSVFNISNEVKDIDDQYLDSLRRVHSLYARLTNIMLGDGLSESEETV